MDSILDRTGGYFLTFEGGDGCGKSTQMALLGKYLKGRKIPHKLTQEPGGSKLGKKLMKLLLDPKGGPIAARAELFLYLADRAQHISQVVLPALNDCKLVASSRYMDATVAYQAYGRGIRLENVIAANDLATGGIEPELTILLEISPEKGLKRLRRKKDRLEAEKLEFHKRVHQGYNMLAKANPVRIKVVDAAKSVAKVHQEIVAIIEKATGLGG